MPEACRHGVGDGTFNLFGFQQTVQEDVGVQEAGGFEKLCAWGLISTKVTSLVLDATSIMFLYFVGNFFGRIYLTCHCLYLESV